MKLIISGTNRNKSYTLKISRALKNIYQSLNEKVEILDLRDIPFDLLNKNPYSDILPKEFLVYADKVSQASGIIMVCPEYNGTFPGVLKYFIDHWHYPQSFEKKPFTFVGLGGRFGGLRAVEHLQDIFSYRKSYIYSDSVIITEVQTLFDKEILKDLAVKNFLDKQCRGFIEFCNKIK